MEFNEEDDFRFLAGFLSTEIMEDCFADNISGSSSVSATPETRKDSSDENKNTNSNIAKSTKNWVSMSSGPLISKSKQT